MLEAYNINVFGAIQTFETFASFLGRGENPRVVFMQVIWARLRSRLELALSYLSEFQIGA